MFIIFRIFLFVLVPDRFALEYGLGLVNQAHVDTFAVEFRDDLLLDRPVKVFAVAEDQVADQLVEKASWLVNRLNTALGMYLHAPIT